MSDNFYRDFRDAVINAAPDLEEECDRRIQYQLEHYKMIPKEHHKLMFRLTRSYPTPPVFAYVVLGTLGTNIARYCTVGRPGCHRDQSERTGAFYNFIGESRLGKGVAMNLLLKLGGYIDNMRKERFDALVEGGNIGEGADADRVQIKRGELMEQMQKKMPGRVFLCGGNALQTTAEAGRNGGCGIVAVPEMKNGKAKYTNPDGSYGPLLSFFDDQISGTTFRQAEKILSMSNCRMQLIAAGVPEDWAKFVEKAGSMSGALARVVPIIGLDKEMVRLHQERLPPFSFELDGIKTILKKLEEAMGIFTSDKEPPIVICLSESELLHQYRQDNATKTSVDRGDDSFDLRKVLKTLLDSSPPKVADLQREGSGIAAATLFLRQTEAEFYCAVASPGDKNVIQGLSTNLLRIASDFFWADFICKWLSCDGTLDPAKELLIDAAINNIVQEKKAIISTSVVKAIFKFLHYCILGGFHLNKYAAAAGGIMDRNDGARKRKRIIQRMAKGINPGKRRRFHVSKVKEALKVFTSDEVDRQLKILVVHEIVEKPTSRTVRLVRNFSLDAMAFLQNKCLYDGNDIEELQIKISSLNDE